ncbi:MAG: helix-turn-helix domain-containing protein [Caldilineaceae bacterium]
MNIDGHTAQHIIEQIGKGIAANIWVVNQANQILAGPQPPRRDCTALPVYGWAIDNKPAADNYTSLPLCCATEEVGRLIIEDVTQHGAEAIQMAHTLAELIIHQRAVFDQVFDRQWALDKFVGDLLHGRFADASQTALENASVLEVNLDTPRLAVVVDLQPLLPHEQSALAHDHTAPGRAEQCQRQQRRQVLDLAHRVLGMHNDNIYSFFEEQRLVMLIALDIERLALSEQQIKGKIQTFIDELSHYANNALSAGMGAYHPSWQALAHSYRDACFALKTGQPLLGPGHVYTAFDLGLAGFVCAHDDALRSQIADHLLHPLFDKPELLQTLTVFLETNLSAGIAAQKLHLHRHGLTYRLKKIYELTGLDPCNFRDATQLVAALQWRQVAQAA